MIEKDQVKDKEWVNKHTLTPQEFRQLVLEKLERARLNTLVRENRKLNELA
jgi:DNA-directed RNA polymerase subunit H (RpoH/RPB5)